MNRSQDDDALRWDGDDDTPAGSSATRSASGGATLPPGFTAVGKGSGAIGATDDAKDAVTSPAEPDASATHAAPRPEHTGDSHPHDHPAAPTGNAALIATGILAGFYALFTIGWIIGGLRLESTAQFLIAPMVFWVNLWLAIAAPALWFATIWVLTRTSRAWVRFAWLVAGAVLLVPWPFAMIGAVGQ